MAEELTRMLTTGGLALLAALVVGLGLPALIGLLGKRNPSVKYLVRRIRIPFLVLSLVVATNAFVAAYRDRKSTRLNSSHVAISYAVFCLKKKKRCSMTTA